MNKNFDENCKFYIDQLFDEHYKQWEEKINQKVIQDLTMLAKYKGELAKSFNEVKEQRNTLISCMNDIQNTQDELKWLVLDLIKVITGKYPDSRGRITGEEFQ
jgi:hypothetical protein